MKKNNKLNSDFIKRSLILMKYDLTKTLNENYQIVEQSNSDMKQTFGNCLNRLTYEPFITSTDTNTIKLSKWAKSIGESFSYQMYQLKSGWGSKFMDDIIVECKNDKLSVRDTFLQDLKNLEEEEPKSPYFCFNKNAANRKWTVNSKAGDGITPNYLGELFNTFGTYDSCKIFEFLGDIPDYDWSKTDTEPYHKLLQIFSVGSFFIPLVGPFVSLGFDLGDASLYLYENQKFNAGLGFAFSIIPFWQIAKKIPFVGKIGEKAFETLLKKVHLNALGKYVELTNDEVKALKLMYEQKEWAGKFVTKIITKKVIKSIISKMSLEEIVKLMYKLNQKYPKTMFITELGLTFGGIYYSFEKLAEIFGITNVPNLNKNEFLIKKLTKEYNSNPEKYQNFVYSVIDSKMTDQQKNEEFGKRLPNI